MNVSRTDENCPSLQDLVSWKRVLTLTAQARCTFDTCSLHGRPAPAVTGFAAFGGGVSFELFCLLGGLIALVGCCLL